MSVIFRGKPACVCLATWLKFYERELRARGVLPPKGVLSIYQLIGGAVASGGTHASGGAFDITDLTGDLDVWVARQMGADATWARRPPKFVPHLHGVLRGCPHNGPARYQIAEVDAGGDGLVGSAPDDGPRPLSNRTWEEGIAWHHAQAKIRRRAAITAKIQPILEEKRKLAARIDRLRKIRSGL